MVLAGIKVNMKKILILFCMILVPAISFSAVLPPWSVTTTGNTSKAYMRGSIQITTPTARIILEDGTTVYQVIPASNTFTGQNVMVGSTTLSYVNTATTTVNNLLYVNGYTVLTATDTSKWYQNIDANGVIWTSTYSVVMSSGGGGGGGSPDFSPIHRWKFDEGSGGTATDEVASKTLTLGGGSVWQAGGYDGTGYCVDVSASNSWIEGADSDDYGIDAVGDYTLSMWVYFKDNTIFAGERGWCGFGTNAYANSGSYLQATIFPMTYLYPYTYMNAIQYYDFGIYNTAYAKDWFFVALTYKSDHTLNIYFAQKGNTLQTIVSKPATHASVSFSTLKMILGAYNNSGASQINGYIDMFRMYNKILTQGELSTVMGL
jgi:hypothetical protein